MLNVLAYKPQKTGDQNQIEALRDFDWPKLAALTPNLTAACFSTIKLFAARAILDDAKMRGLLRPGTMVVESTSGTFGLALAMLRPHYGYELTIVSDPVIDAPLKTRLEQMGARVDIIEAQADGSYQKARLARVAEILAETPGAYFTNQYHNPVNTAGYAPLADYLEAQLGHIDYLVGAVGTGGSMCGTARRLKEFVPALKIVGVDTHRSVVFGQPNGPRALRGLGNSLVPSNVDHTLFDEVHWVSAAEAYIAARELLRDYGIFQGGTSGAAYLAARYVAAQNPTKKVAVLFPDDGHRYVETVYNDAHLHALPGGADPLPKAPVIWQRPDETGTRWAMMHWNKRKL